MESSRNFFTLQCFFFIFIIMFTGFSRSDVAEDQAKCGMLLAGLLPCLDFVHNGGDQHPPTAACCTVLKNITQNTPECLCILVKDRNDPALSYLKINATLALNLPDRCTVPADVGKCPELLHLAPNSTDAQIFNDFANCHKKSNDTAAVPSVPEKPGDNGSSGKSDGFKKDRWLNMKMVLGSIVVVMFFVLPKPSNV